MCLHLKLQEAVFVEKSAMKYQKILEYFNIVTVLDAENSLAVLMPQTYSFLLNNLNGFPVKNMSVDSSPETQNISQHLFVNIVVPHYHGYRKVKKWLSFQQVRWIQILALSHFKTYFGIQKQSGTQM